VLHGLFRNIIVLVSWHVDLCNGGLRGTGAEVFKNVCLRYGPKSEDVRVTDGRRNRDVPENGKIYT
jgi:hypothetical protein